MLFNAIQLLVSVRDEAEAVVALESGADIIDVKEPDAGPLGFAGIETVTRVKNAVGNRVPVSAALGECTDWLNVAVQNHPSPLSFSGLDFVKLGLAGMLVPEHARIDLQRQSSSTGRAVELSDWTNDWCRVRRQLNSMAPTGSAVTNAVRAPDWVAVAYADYAQADAPSVWQVLDAAAKTGCSTLLIDTFAKDGSGTLDWLLPDELLELRVAARNRQLRFALAGQLTGKDVPVVRTIGPDIFAVRGAVCEGSDRQATICGTKIRKLKQTMNDRRG